MKKIFIESSIISLVLTVLMFSAVGTVLAAYPGPDDDTDGDPGDYGSWVVSAVHAEYGGVGYYDWGWWWSVREYGSSSAASLMYLWWKVDGVPIEYSTSSDFITDGGWIYATDYISSRTRARFTYGGNYWWLDATAIEYVC